MSTNQRHHPDDLVLGGLGLREGLGLQHLRDDGRLLLRVGNVASAPLLRHGAQQLRVALHQRTRLLATRPNLGTAQVRWFTWKVMTRLVIGLTQDSLTCPPWYYEI